MKVSYAKDKMGNSGCVAHSPYIDISVYGFHAHFAVKIARFNSEIMRAEFP